MCTQFQPKLLSPRSSCGPSLFLQLYSWAFAPARSPSNLRWGWHLLCPGYSSKSSALLCQCHPPEFKSLMLFPCFLLSQVWTLSLVFMKILHEILPEMSQIYIKFLVFLSWFLSWFSVKVNSHSFLFIIVSTFLSSSSFFSTNSIMLPVIWCGKRSRDFNVEKIWLESWPP